MPAARPKVANWVNVLAQLQWVDAEHLGRLVLVERAAQVPAVAVAGHSTPVWHVYVLGAPLRLDGSTWREADVVQDCLQPLCRLPEVIADNAILEQAERDFSVAAAELSAHLAKHPIPIGDLDESLETAARAALGPRRWPLLLVRGKGLGQTGSSA